MDDDENDEEELIIHPTSIIYDESDLLSITKLKIISLKIKFEKEKLLKNDKSKSRYNFDNSKNYMNNSTIINDFNPIIEKLITNNPHIKIKFIELI